MVTQHHAQTFGHRDERSQMRVEEIGFAQPLAMAGREVVDDAGKTHARRAPRNEPPRTDRRARVSLRSEGRELLVRGGIVKTSHQRKRIDRAAQGRKAASSPCSVGRRVEGRPRDLTANRRLICIAGSPDSDRAAAASRCSIFAASRRCSRFLALARPALHAVRIGPQDEPFRAVADDALGVPLLNCAAEPVSLHSAQTTRARDPRTALAKRRQTAAFQVVER